MDDKTVPGAPAIAAPKIDVPTIDIVAILAKRRARAVQEDKERPAAMARRRAAMATIQKRLEEEAKHPALTPEQVREMVAAAVAAAVADALAGRG